MRIHIVAVSGTGMGPLAGLLSELGHEVTGSDVAFDPPIGPRLAEWGVTCLQGFSPDHLASRPDLVVIGNSCRADNPEARFAIDSGLPYTHIGGALQRFALPGTRPLVVTGTHGKTTTSALAAGLLQAAGLEPGYLIGGVPHGLERSFRAASRRGRSLLKPSPVPFVLEGDEYDTAFFEKTAKFLHYCAEVVILTSLEHDHVDIYPTFEDYAQPFRALVGSISEAGVIVANAMDQHVVDVVRTQARARVVWYALDGEPTFGVSPDWLVAPSTTDAQGSHFDLFLGGVAVGRWSTPLIGRHNLGNAAAALAAATHGFGVDVSLLRSALASLHGVARRQELLGTPDGVFLYDDFAHHPSAVRETLRALRTRHGSGRLIAVFEPRSATACRKLHQDVYPDAFAEADLVLLAPVARELAADQRLDTARLAEDLVRRGTPARHFASLDAIVEATCQAAHPGDVVALLSNGTFGGVHEKLGAALSAREQAARSAHAQSASAPTRSGDR